MRVLPCPLYRSTPPARAGRGLQHRALGGSTRRRLQDPLRLPGDQRASTTKDQVRLLERVPPIDSPMDGLSMSELPAL